jgi:hypothetical protein
MLNPDPAQKGGRGIRIIGYSITADALISVIVLEHDGTVYGATAFKSNTTDHRIYQRKE